MSNITERLNTNGIIVNFDYPNRVSENGRRLIKLSPNSMSGVKTNITNLKEEKAKNEKSDSPSMAQPNSQPIPVDQAQAIDKQSAQNTTQSFYNVVPLNFSKAIAQGDYHRGVRLGSNGAQHIAGHLKLTDVDVNQTSVEPISPVSATPEEVNLHHEEISANSANIPPEEQPVEATDESKKILNELHISTENLISVNNEKQASQAARDEKKKIHDETFKVGEMADSDLEKAIQEKENATKRKEQNIEDNKQLIEQAIMMKSTMVTATRVTEENVAKLKQEANDLETETNKEQHRIEKARAETAVANQTAAQENKIADLYENKNMEIRKHIDEARARIQAENIQLQPIDMDKIEAEQGSLTKNDEEDSYTYFRRAA